jgi:hypothetical protein
MLAAGLLLSISCAPSNDAPVRSPTSDFPHPPAQTSDGRVVGVDGRPPEDTLRSGARLGPAGYVAPAPTPGGVPEGYFVPPPEPTCVKNPHGPVAAPPCSSSARAPTAPVPPPAPPSTGSAAPLSM